MLNWLYWWIDEFDEIHCSIHGYFEEIGECAGIRDELEESNNEFDDELEEFKEFDQIQSSLLFSVLFPFVVPLCVSFSKGIVPSTLGLEP